LLREEGMTPSKESLALRGGSKALAHVEGRSRPKIGVQEFLSIAERFGFSEAALDGIRAAISERDLGPGPFLARYGTPSSEKTKGAAFEQLARETFGSRYAIGVSSGTAALHCAFVAAGVGPGTEVLSFVMSTSLWAWTLSRSKD
jgi:hypothetical protein